jgi:hypothetical protein
MCCEIKIARPYLVSLELNFILSIFLDIYHLANAVS